MPNLVQICSKLSVHKEQIQIYKIIINIVVVIIIIIIIIIMHGVPLFW